MPRGRRRVSFDTVSDFDPGRIVAYKDYELSFKKICQRIGRNQVTVMLICQRWMLEETTNRRGQSHSPRCTTARDVRIAVRDRGLTSRTKAQQIQSITHHWVSASTIRHHL
ncbi:transposable element Tcb1 transposase [Trichonephila clavipes]|uniref:Transposable element Tcb1 transposase n=1 Tax=Trichonephila clavipes TaxID=2585209 RepID=A0A8X6SRI3_TRICX|nr:transposable element Tcb1 transposase [Trichonephila clavipes]